MALASERLLALLVREIAAFEADVASGEDDNPRDHLATPVAGAGPGAADVAADGAQPGTRRRVAAVPAAAKRGPAKRVGATAASGAAVGAKRMGPKERIEHIGQMAKVLEKLLELRRLETLAAAGGPQDDAEAARLGAELLSRLRSLDARRRHGELLFGPDASAGGTGAAGAAGAVGDGAVAANAGDRALGTERVDSADRANAAGSADATGGGR
ncbi:hypothetical protein [Aurantimonas endophytica]|uniref:Uncharacterized protein n=1 Tax=Aurantimonas endophytica TaxID=1522175 RepID=A0A7W6HFS1_9HYPH|nr:hypothetical protein [Aurantimonas endophytica]MBB4004197.1 hypothetical protein [Aurantimonas endophytica]MCO6405040.1 hypothetical protein [Aurantimonas endophytica]